MSLMPRRWGRDFTYQLFWQYLPMWLLIFVIIGAATLILYLVFKGIDKTKGNGDWEKQHFAEVRKKNSRQYDRMYAEWQSIQGNSPDPEPEREVDPRTRPL